MAMRWSSRAEGGGAGGESPGGLIWIKAQAPAGRSLASPEPQRNHRSAMPELRISPEKVCFAILKAREFDAKEAAEEMYEGSNPTDDQEAAVLEDNADDPALEELTRFLGSQNEDELEDLLALMWLGRGDYAFDEWDEALAAVRAMPNKHIVPYLLGTPTLADHLEEGLAQFGRSCEEFELGRL